MASSFKQGLSNFISTIINACCVFIISSIVHIAYFALSFNTVPFYYFCRVLQVLCRENYYKCEIYSEHTVSQDFKNTLI